MIYTCAGLPGVVVVQYYTPRCKTAPLSRAELVHLVEAPPERRR
jgi:hypothetical protein